ncbi:MAG TPA: translation initiation factor IF-3, partial [Candidatus Dormibacteraeota bacterium]|nr:translation initiation factor IF-3 [Candidatus Dormibacteraeota bacterium]
GRRLLDRVADAAKDVAIIERQPIMEGRNLFMILAPLHKPQPVPAAAAAVQQRKEASQSA